jgi:hypothetical protein
LLEQEVFPTTTLEPGESIMRPDRIPVHLHTVRYETVKTLIIEARETIREEGKVYYCLNNLLLSSLSG